MALTASRTSLGFEPIGVVGPNEIIYVPGDPGDTYTQGDSVVGTVGEGVVDPIGANEGGQVGYVDQTTVCPANTVAFPYPRDFDPAARGDSQNLTLIGLKPSCPAGTPIYLSTFANHYDDTVTSWTASTRTLVVGTGMSVNDYPNGALVYVYEGPGIGQVNVVEDYVHGSLALVMHRPFETALTSASKVIVIAGEGVASRGVGFFNRCEPGAAGSLTVNQGADDGDYVVYLDWRKAATYLKDLMLPVIPARYFMLA